MFQQHPSPTPHPHMDAHTHCEYITDISWFWIISPHSHTSAQAGEGSQGIKSTYKFFGPPKNFLEWKGINITTQVPVGLSPIRFTPLTFDIWPGYVHVSTVTPAPLNHTLENYCRDDLLGDEYIVKDKMTTARLSLSINSMKWQYWQTYWTVNLSTWVIHSCKPLPMYYYLLST